MIRRLIFPSIVFSIAFTVLCGLVYPLAVLGIGQAAFNKRVNGSFVKNDKGQVVGSSLIGQSFTDKNGNPDLNYFQSRPSAAGTNGYDASASSASNLGPSDPRLVGFIPGFNTVGLDGNSAKTNPFGTKDDPYCVPTDPQGNPVTSPSAGQKYAKDKSGAYVCDSNTVPERVSSYRSTYHLAPNAPVPVDAVTASGSGLDPNISVDNARLQAPVVASNRHMSLNQVLALVGEHTTNRTLGVLGEKVVNVLQLNLALDRAQGR